ncbi:glucan 1,4-alpha-glucosidase [Labrys monachus]|uniref:Glucoamylase n=1 Tax=Labrys monachus TaxID=217067 RepID=A0ABU0FJG3_9HYPH|nr:glucan 1,4-alpha-glucosidase [Labrys monachus]MDQ0394747.1 glucoamylase [Labrys monachus]
MSGAVPPGAPGLDPRWTSSAKSGVGTSGSPSSRLWFAVSHGILNEVYYPRIDLACLRDLGLLVTATDYFSEEKRDADPALAMTEDGVPIFRLVNTARDGRYRISKTILADPFRESVLQDIRFEALHGEWSDYAVHVLLAPHLVNRGSGNTAWIDDYKGYGLLHASGTNGVSLALAASVPWLARSAGFVGTSDGWQTLRRGEGVNTDYDRAENGNVALTGTLDLSAAGHVLLSLGLGLKPEEAAFNAIASLQQGTASAIGEVGRIWRGWHAGLERLDDLGETERTSYRTSAAVLAVHRTGAFTGGAIASLSTPWGFNKGDDDLGGYHLVWPRDLVETAGGFLAAGSTADALGILDYLAAIQEGDGHWAQNNWIDGHAYWDGIQMDETAFPILLYDMLRRAGAFADGNDERYFPMLQKAASFVVRQGPVTDEDRWEEDAGYSPFTLAVEIAALLAAADAMDASGRPETATYLRETADGWHAELDDWTFASGTDLAAKLGIAGYYVRIGPGDNPDGAALGSVVPIKNRSPQQAALSAQMLLSPDALALVRFGLRSADDPRMVGTVKAIDDLLRRDLPDGPYWYRYNNDGYGEHEDGSAFDGTGVGRLWPLLTGERAHFELAAGRPDEARRLLKALEASAGPGGLLPEQIWDGEDLPDRELFFGGPTGSAMPLVWAHGEHIKLLRSLRDGKVFDTPPQTVERYLEQGVVSNRRFWRINHQRRTIRAGQVLRIELLEPSAVRWSFDGWAGTSETATADTGLALYYVDIPAETLPAGTEIRFRIAQIGGPWQDPDFGVTVMG